jgi:plastocyanin
MTAGLNLKLGSILLVVIFWVAFAGLYAGAKLVDRQNASSAAAGGGGGGFTGGPVAVKIVAKNLTFDKRTISASTGAQVTVTLDNEDVGVSHNIAFYTKKGATPAIASLDLIAGVSSKDLVFNAPDKPGNYYFQCDVHDTMNGTFSVK